MTDPNLTHLTIVVDRSGSMAGIAADMNGGIRELLRDQSSLPGSLEVSVVTFDHMIENPFTNVRPDDIKVDLVVPRGSTALYDAVGRAITELGEDLASRLEQDRPHKVIFMIVTDGMENSSREFTAPVIKAMVDKQTETYAWEFMYLAANVDAFATGAQMGYAKGRTMGYAATDVGTQSMVATASAAMTRSRSGLDLEFTEDERAAAMDV